MGTDLIIPEITLIEKLKEVEKTLAPVVYEQLKNELTVCYEKESENLPAKSRAKRRVFLSDFVNKAINLPLEIIPKLSTDVERQLYRLHLFCCEQTVHNAEVRRNPLLLGYKALQEMHDALMGILISYRLIHPECPYSWDETFFEYKIITHKGPDGHTIIKFASPLTEEILNAAITEEMVTDWLIYRAHDHNGIRTLMDIKNNLLDIPNFQRGGKPYTEFSRFERKLQEKRNRKKEKQDDALELELRKKVVETVAGKAVEQMLSNGVSPKELLNQAINGDIKQLTENLISQQPEKLIEKKEKESKKLISEKKDTKEIDNYIAGLLGTND